LALSTNLLQRFLSGERTALSRVITVVENREEGYGDLLDGIFPRTGRAYRIGVTGPPGAGKSTLVSSLVLELRKRDVRVGVIAVDPTSPFTGGALLGDRIRMQDIGCDSGVFVRSMATRGALGGLAEAAGDVIDVMDAFGNDFVLTETVGVGQCELDIAQACYTTIVVIVPESGDSVQAMKAGLMEIADVIVINKSDREGSDRIATETRAMLDLRRPHAFSPSHTAGDHKSGAGTPGGVTTGAEAGKADAEEPWRVPVLQTVASRGDGIPELVKAVEAHREYLSRSGRLEMHRRANVEATIRGVVESELSRKVWDAGNLERLERLVAEVMQGRKTPRQASGEILAMGGRS
jgi:LAO/AO transport system kinase